MSHHSPQLEGSVGITQRREETSETEVGQDYCEMVSSGPDTGKTLMESLWQWLSVQDLLKIGPINISLWRGRGIHEAPTFPKGMLTANGG